MSSKTTEVNMNNKNNRHKEWIESKRKICSSCNIRKILHYSKSCRKCYTNIEKESYKEFTIKEYQEKLYAAGKHPSWVNANLRGFNRTWNVKLTKLPCACCGYTKHVELAHIKAVTSFPDTATLGEVNHPTNIVQLCRNCHWEFDKGLIVLN